MSDAENTPESAGEATRLPHGGHAAEPQPTAPSAEPASEPQQATPESDRDQSYSREHVRELRAEAKKHRLARREADDRAVELQKALDDRDHQTIERIAAERLSDASDVWLVHQPGDFRDDEGNLDEDVVRTVIEQLAAERPHWAKPAPQYDGGVRRGAQSPPSFGQALKQRVTGGT